MDGWYWLNIFLSGLLAGFFTVAFLLLLSNDVDSGGGKVMTVKLSEGEQVVGASKLVCNSLRFHVPEFSLISKSGRAVVDEASCVIVKKVE